MEEDYAELKVLVDLGLTPVSAKVYLTLHKFGALEISKLAELAKVARPDTYRTLLKLQKLGLIEKLVKRPSKYQAIPNKDALSLLLRAKTEEYKELRKETRLLINAADIEDAKKKNIKEASSFVLIPQGRRLTTTIRNAIKKTQFSLYNVLSWKRFSQGIINRFADDLEKACARNVKIRFIIEKPPKSKTTNELIEFCRKYPCLQIRFITNELNTIFAVYDQKEIIIVATSRTDFLDSPALWSNSESLVSLGLDHFEELWSRAKEF